MATGNNHLGGGKRKRHERGGRERRSVQNGVRRFCRHRLFSPASFRPAALLLTRRWQYFSYLDLDPSPIAGAGESGGAAAAAAAQAAHTYAPPIPLARPARVRRPQPNARERPPARARSRPIAPKRKTFRDRVLLLLPSPPNSEVRSKQGQTIVTPTHAQARASCPSRFAKFYDNRETWWKMKIIRHQNLMFVRQKAA